MDILPPTHTAMGQSAACLSAQGLYSLPCRQDQLQLLCTGNFTDYNLQTFIEASWHCRRYHSHFFQKVYKCLHYFICIPTMCMHVQFLNVKAQHLLVVLVRCGRSERIPIILIKWVWYLVQWLLSLDCAISPSTDLRKLHQMVYWVYCTCKGVSYTYICTETTFILNPYLVVDLRMSCSVGHLSHVFIDMADFKLVENGWYRSDSPIVLVREVRITMWI